jgi:hypothetical protein
MPSCDSLMGLAGVCGAKFAYPPDLLAKPAVALAKVPSRSQEQPLPFLVTRDDHQQCGSDGATTSGIGACNGFWSRCGRFPSGDHSHSAGWRHRRLARGQDHGAPRLWLLSERGAWRPRSDCWLLRFRCAGNLRFRPHSNDHQGHGRRGDCVGDCELAPKAAHAVVQRSGRKPPNLTRQTSTPGGSAAHPARLFSALLTKTPDR